MKLKSISMLMAAALMMAVLISCNSTTTPTQSGLNDDSEKLSLSGISSDPMFAPPASSGEQPPAGDISQQYAGRMAHNIVQGDVVSSEKENFRGIVVWKIKILTPQLSIVEIRIDATLGLVVALSGYEGRIDYDIKPLENFLKLSEAIKIALQNVRGEVVKWEIKYHQYNGWKFEFTVKSNGKHYKVKIHAKSGRLVDKVKGADDYDDD